MANKRQKPTDKLCDRIYHILKAARASRSPYVTVWQLSRSIYPDNPSKTDPRIREACAHLRNVMGKRVYSGRKGMYIAVTPSDIRPYIADIKSRMAEMHQNLKAAERDLRDMEIEGGQTYIEPAEPKPVTQESFTEEGAKDYKYKKRSQETSLFGGDTAEPTKKHKHEWEY